MIAELGDRSISADSQRVELAALRAQVEAMKISVAEYERTIKETEERLTRERSASAAATSDLDRCAQQTRRAQHAQRRSGEAARGADRRAEALNKRVQELEASLGDQTRLLTEREQENQRLRGESEAARKSESDLRGELAAVSSNVADKFKAEIDQLQAQLATAAMERTKLQAEIAKLQQEAETTTLVRDRVNNVAAEVARLTAALEGPDSPIATMLANGGERPWGERQRRRRQSRLGRRAKGHARRPHPRAAVKRRAPGVVELGSFRATLAHFRGNRESSSRWPPTPRRIAAEYRQSFA